MRATPILLITLGIVVNRIDSHKSTEYNELWSVWKSQYDKQYENEKEEEIRRSKWIENIEKIHSHNLRYDLGLETFTLGINQFTDIDWKEFHSQYAMNKQLEIPESSYIEEDYDVNNVGWTPESYDWRHLNIVNEPRDQGSCHGSYAFAVTASTESQYALRTSNRVNLSVQQFLDCTREYGNMGCYGGYTFTLFIYLQNLD
ncbi:unnamed protein product [Heterobilharzia americana]|nr:unnamed protein product [Heterobilharzia americana]